MSGRMDVESVELRRAMPKALPQHAQPDAQADALVAGASRTACRDAGPEERMAGESPKGLRCAGRWSRRRSRRAGSTKPGASARYAILPTAWERV
jgi:hypothetical protein